MWRELRRRARHVLTPEHNIQQGHTMHTMDDSQELKPLRSSWSDAHRFSRRTSTVDYNYYPHEMRTMKRRQKCCESLISVFLIFPYWAIILSSVGSFYLLYMAQTDYYKPPPNEEQRTCILGDGGPMCIVMYVFQGCIAVGGILLLLITLVKACWVWYKPMLLVIDFSLLFFSLFIAMAMSVTMTIANIVSVNTVVCDNSDTGSGGGCAAVWFTDAMFVSWGVAGVVFITILMEALLVLMVRKCRQRLDYQRL